jgi:hypothetical protein
MAEGAMEPAETIYIQRSACFQARQLSKPISEVMYTENEKTIRNRCMDRLRVRWAGNNGYDRNVEDVIPAPSRNTAGTVIIDEDSDRSAKYAREEEENEKCLYCDRSRMDYGYVGAGLAWKALENVRN